LRGRALLILSCGGAATAHAEDGDDLWLRYRPVESPWLERYRRAALELIVYFHRADSQGIGFDRTTLGSDAVSQYRPPLADMFNDVQGTPEKYLLWFHHVSWDYKLSSGRSVWEELVGHYSAGVEAVRGMRTTWSALSPYVDAERYAEVRAFLAIQEREALWWRDACLAYFQNVSRRPFPPPGFAPPAHPLAHYESISVP